MTSVNHFATGAAIALVVTQPAAALPLAVLSHFALDALPHYGEVSQPGISKIIRRRQTLIVELLGLAGFAAVLSVVWSGNWWVLLAGVAAMLPDIVWPYRLFRYDLRHKPAPQPNKLTRFHDRIQVLERSWGSIFELAWFIGIFWCLQRLTV